MAASSKKERLLAMNVRALALGLVYKYLNDDSEANAKYRWELLMKLAPTLLPRKTEIGGDSDNPTPIQIYAGKSITSVPGYQSNTEDIQSNQEN